MKKALMGLTAASVLAAFATVPATPAAADWPNFDDRHHSRNDNRHYYRDRDNGVTLRLGNPGAYRCNYRWRHGVRYRHCEPRGGASFSFRF